MADIQSYFQELESLLASDNGEIIGNNLKLHTSERLFQLIVDTAVDINTHLIAELDLPVPPDYQSTFVTLAEHGVFPPDFALKIAPSVGLRNLVIHKYGRVDLKRMIEDIRSEIGDYLEYLKFLNDFLEKKT